MARTAPTGDVREGRDTTHPGAYLMAALWAPLALAIVAYVALFPLYRTNDDPGMWMLAQGAGYVDHPTPYLLFSNVVWGHLLAALYGLLPSIPWYPVLSTTVHYAATATLVFVVLRRGASIPRLVALVTFLLAFDLLFWVRPHFTVTSAWAGLAAFTLWNDRAAEGRPLPPGAGILAAILWLAAVLIRFHSAALVLLLALPSFALRSWQLRRAGMWKTCVVPLAVAGGMLVGLTLYDRQVYRADPGWRDYLETAGAAGRLLDFAAGSDAVRDSYQVGPDGVARLVSRTYAPETYAFVKEVAGWSRNDYDMLMEWFYADPEIYSEAKLRRVAEGLPGRSGWAALKPMWHDPRLGLLLASVALCWAQVGPGRFGWIQSSATLAAGLLVAGWLVLDLSRFPAWVYQPLLAFVGCVAIAGIDRTAVDLSFRSVRAWVTTLALLSWVALFPLGVAALSAGAVKRHRLNRSLEQFLGELPREPERLYVVWGGFPLEGLRIFDDLAERLAGFSIYSVGGDIRGPFNREQLRRRGIVDIHEAIFRDPRVRVISDPRRAGLLIRHVEEHYGAAVTARAVARPGGTLAGKFSVYRFLQAPGALSGAAGSPGAQDNGMREVEAR